MSKTIDEIALKVLKVLGSDDMEALREIHEEMMLMDNVDDSVMLAAFVEFVYEEKELRDIEEIRLRKGYYDYLLKATNKSITYAFSIGIDDKMQSVFGIPIIIDDNIEFSFKVIYKNSM